MDSFVFKCKLKDVIRVGLSIFVPGYLPFIGVFIQPDVS